MAIPKSKPIAFTPRGLVDAFDATAKFPGACQSLANFIFDQSNPELIRPRPGVQQMVSLSGSISSPGFISVHVTVGSRVYGMVASSLNAGKDQPFIYDMGLGTFLAITGITNANTPTSPGTSGDWVPPTMAMIGTMLIVTHPGFTGAAGAFFGVLDTVALTWTATNTTINALSSVPRAVINFNNRAYFAVGAQLQYTDALLPTQRTNASQTLTIGDSTPIRALAGLPIQTTGSGVLAALTVFKLSQIWQITGDTTTSDLSENFISLTIGTTSPRTVAQAPYGLYFTSQAGGPYFIDVLGTLRSVTYELGNAEPDIQTPFQNAQDPTRWAAAYIASTYRVCGGTVLLGQATTNDYWFDEHRRRWSGPHSFAYDCASPNGTTFVLSSALNPGILILSEANPSLSSVYSDLGTPYSCTMLSSTFPKTGTMLIKQVVESQIELGAFPTGATYTIQAQNAQGNVRDTVTITTPGAGGPLWGGGDTWGDGVLWASNQNKAPITYAVPWHAPLVFEKLQLQITVPAAPNVQVGTFYARYQMTGYMTTQQGVTA